jgi:hypothetical protein
MRVLTPAQLNEEIAKAKGEERPDFMPELHEMGAISDNYKEWVWEGRGYVIAWYPRFNCLNLLDVWRLKDEILKTCDERRYRLKSALGCHASGLRSAGGITELDEREAALELSRICYYALTGEVVQVKMEG